MRRAAAAGLAAACLAAAGCGERPPENMSAEEVAGQLGAMRIDPGLWELSSDVVDVRGPDLPVEIRNRMIGPRRRLRHCISPEQAARPGANFLAMRSDDACVYRDFSLEGERMRGMMICPDATAVMDGRYGPRAYDLRMEMTSPIPGGATMTLKLRAQGRRVGDCEEETAP